jgi:hypothetical protein
MIGGKSYLADPKQFSCIEHPNYNVYDQVLHIIEENYIKI